MVASLPCGCELRRRRRGGDAFNRLFGFDSRDGRRSGSVTGSIRTGSIRTGSIGAPGHERSAVRRRVAGFSLRSEARDAACGIEPCEEAFSNIQGTEAQRHGGVPELPRRFAIFCSKVRSEKPNL